MRPVANLVRGKRVPDAINILNFLPQKATHSIRLTIESAVHNLLDRFPNERIDEQELFVQEIRVDEGPRFKRFRPVSRGRAHPIKKRTSHLTVVISAVKTEDE